MLSGYVDMIVVRTFDDARLASMAAASSVPVVNALTDGYHPCQLLADLLTIRQAHGTTRGKTLAYVGDAAIQHGATRTPSPAARPACTSGSARRPDTSRRRTW